MKLIASLVFIIFFQQNGVSQTFIPFTWKDKLIKFSAVEMEVKNSVTKKDIFKGYKDSRIEIDHLPGSPLSGTVAIKLGGYFEKTFNSIDKVRTETTPEGMDVTYTVSDGHSLAVLIFSYQPDDDKPSFIVIATNDNYLDKAKSKQLDFLLRGLD
ncbi:MAG TPA: hypothetical protein VM935_00125 [Chitinophagaceae bacterium]|nr:hypothetical protein [Chitinophagaceae bacterium]